MPGPLLGIGNERMNKKHVVPVLEDLVLWTKTIDEWGEIQNVVDMYDTSHF